MVKFSEVKEGEFRSTVCTGDLDLVPELIEEFITNSGLVEVGWVFIKNPIEVPYIGYFYSKGIAINWEEFLNDAVRDLLIMNPGIDSVGTGKMVTYLYELLVRAGYKNDKKSIYRVIVNVIDLVELLGGVSRLPIGVSKNVSVLFERGSKLTPSFKRSITIQCKSSTLRLQLGDVIQTAIEMASISEHEFRVLDRGVVNRNIVSVGGPLELSRYKFLDSIKANSKLFLLSLNESRYFTSDKETDDFIKFLNSDNVSYSSLAKELGVSKEKISKFKKVKGYVGYID